MSPQKRERLRVLVVDDNEADAYLIQRAVQTLAQQVEIMRVETEAQMVEALNQGPWDVVLVDWIMPQFDAPAALAVLRSRNPSVPCIVVSGMSGESFAVMAIKLGAVDFVAKESLSSLPIVLGRELDLNEQQQCGRN